MRHIPEGLQELWDCDQSQQLLALHRLLKRKMAQWMLIGSPLPCPMALVEGLLREAEGSSLKGSNISGWTARSAHHWNRA